MSINTKLVKALKYWGFYGFLISLVIGMLLLKPLISMIPVVLNLRQVNQDPAITAKRSTQQENPTNNLSGNSNHLFMPLVSFEQTKSESHQPQIVAAQKPKFAAIDFSPNSSSVSVLIHPNTNTIEPIQQAEVSFLPGDDCTLGDGRACIYEFSLSNQSQVVFISVHSGVGAEGEAFRDLIEGTGLNKGRYTPEQVSTHTLALAGAEVIISQDNTSITGMVLTTIARIPSAYLEAYLSLPVEQTLSYAVELGVLDPVFLDEDILVIETCGWQLPGEEAFNPDYPVSTQSIYLGIVQSSSTRTQE